MTPVEAIVNAISTMENNPGTNPGNLRYAGQIGAIPPASKITLGVSPIAAFKSRNAGIAALYRQIWLQVAEGQTLRQIISSYAPSSENNTSVYLQNVASWTALELDIPILEILPPLVKLNATT